MWGLTFILLLLGTFLVNIFFGYWRAGARTFSVPWFLAIHLPVPVVMGLRLVLLSWYPVQIPVFVVAYFAGQYTGRDPQGLFAAGSTMPPRHHRRSFHCSAVPEDHRGVQ